MTQETRVQSLIVDLPKTRKLILDATLLNTQDYKVRITDKADQSRESSSALPDISV